MSILTISKIVHIEYPTIILILTLSVPARSDFGYMTSSNIPGTYVQYPGLQGGGALGDA